MPRIRVNRLFPIALSVEKLGEAIGIHKRILLAAIRAGELPVLKIGAKRRVLIEDAVAWLRRTYLER
jgi:excisionase family DNA binding protein